MLWKTRKGMKRAFVIKAASCLVVATWPQMLAWAPPFWKACLSFLPIPSLLQWSSSTRQWRQWRFEAIFLAVVSTASNVVR